MRQLAFLAILLALALPAGAVDFSPNVIGPNRTATFDVTSAASSADADHVLAVGSCHGSVLLSFDQSIDTSDAVAAITVYNCATESETVTDCPIVKNFVSDNTGELFNIQHPFLRVGSITAPTDSGTARLTVRCADRLVRKGGSGGAEGVTSVESKTEIESCIASATSGKTCRMTADLEISSIVSGTATGASATTLVDSTKDFDDLGVEAGMIVVIEEDGANNTGAPAGQKCLVSTAVDTTITCFGGGWSDECTGAGNPYECCTGADAGCNPDGDEVYQVDDPLLLDVGLDLNGQHSVVLDCNQRRIKSADATPDNANVLVFLDRRHMKHDNAFHFKDCGWIGDTAETTQYLQVMVLDQPCAVSCSGASRVYFERPQVNYNFQIGNFGSGSCPDSDIYVCQDRGGVFLESSNIANLASPAGSLYFVENGLVESGMFFDFHTSVNRVTIADTLFQGTALQSLGSQRPCLDATMDAVAAMTWYWTNTHFVGCNMFRALEHNFNIQLWSGSWTGIGADDFVTPIWPSLGFIEAETILANVDLLVSTFGSGATNTPSFFYTDPQQAADDAKISGSIVDEAGVFAASKPLYLLDSSGSTGDLHTIDLSVATDADGGVQDPPINLANVGLVAGSNGWIHTQGKRYRIKDGALFTENDTCRTLLYSRTDPTEAGATDDFMSLFDHAGSTTEANEDDFISPTGLTSATNLRCDIDVAPDAGKDAWRIVLRADGIDTTLTCDIDETATSCTDSTNSPTIVAGSLINLDVSSEVSGDADPTAAADLFCTLCLDD